MLTLHSEKIELYNIKDIWFIFLISYSSTYSAYSAITIAEIDEEIGEN